MRRDVVRAWAGAWLLGVAGCGAGAERASGPLGAFDAGIVRPTLAREASASPAASISRADAPAGWFEARASGRAGLLRRFGQSRRGIVAAAGERWSFDCPGGAPPGARLTLSCASWAPGEAAPPAELARVWLAPLADPSHRRELAPVPAAPRDWTALDEELGTPDGEPFRVTIEIAPGAERFVALANVGLYVPKDEPATVLLITSDTHRGDHVSVIGWSGRVPTPVVAELAQRGTTFVDCYSSSNITVPSHVALMTGLHPRDSGVRDNLTSIRAEAETLAEAFRDAGFATFAATSISLLTHEHSGLGQGFDRFSATKRRRAGPETIERLRSWLPAAQGRPLFAWCHVFDAHGPYRPPSELVELEWPSDRDPTAADLPAPEGRVPDWAASVRDLAYVRGLYRACVRLVDLALGRLLRAPRFERAIVAFTADHGESLGQHDIWWAHQALYPDTLHVPLVLAWPEGSGSLVERPVRQIDVGRTLLDLAGRESVDFPGRNVLRARDDGDEWPRFALEEGSRSVSINWRGWHLIRYLEDHTRGHAETAIAAGERELFDLGADPRTQDDLSTAEPDTLDELDASLERWLTDGADAGISGAVHDDAETRSRLRELGYLDGADD